MGLDYLRSPILIFDFCVIAISLALEIIFQGQPEAGLLIIARAWRFIRILHGFHETTSDEVLFLFLLYCYWNCDCYWDCCYYMKPSEFCSFVFRLIHIFNLFPLGGERNCPRINNKTRGYFEHLCRS